MKIIIFYGEGGFLVMVHVNYCAYPQPVHQKSRSKSAQECKSYHVLYYYMVIRLQN